MAKRGIIIKRGRLIKVKLDPAAVQYSKLTDKEAKEKVDNIKQQIKDLKALENLGKDPVNVARLKELYTTLAWHKANKNRSKYFRIDTNGPSMRRAIRASKSRKSANLTGMHAFKDRLPNDTRPKERTKSRSKRKKLPILKSVFSRMFGGSKSEGEDSKEVTGK